MNYTLQYEQSLEQFHHQVMLTKLRLEAKYGPQIKQRWVGKK